MKRAAEWWGVILIPETEEEVKRLEFVAQSELVYHYEDGGIFWEKGKSADGMRGYYWISPGGSPVAAPMGKYLVMGR